MISLSNVIIILKLELRSMAENGAGDSLAASLNLD